MMQSIKNFRLATQGITAVLLFGIAFAACGAEQMMRALPAPAAAQPIVAPTAVVAPAKPPNLNATIALPPTTKSGGVMQLSPDAACAMNNTPRISSINGRSSAYNTFSPGDELKISGCGFGKGGTISLLDFQKQDIFKNQPVIIKSWNENNIVVQIPPGITGVLDKNCWLNVMPNGAPAITSTVAQAFFAAREDYSLGLPMRSNRSFTVKYSQAFGVVRNILNPPQATIADHVPTFIERIYSTNGICPNIQDPQTQMVDTWHIDSKTDAFDGGYTAVGIKFINETKPINNGASVGSPGATFSNDTVTVHYQGAKDNLGRCSSRYDIALIVRGPRGILPKRINKPD